MKFLFWLLISVNLFAQTNTNIIGPTAVRPGDSIQIELVGSGTPNTGAAALQAVITVPANYIVKAAVGSQATAAGKTSIACTADNTFCLVYGLNTTVINNGQLIVYTVTIPTNATSGLVQIPLSGVVLASPLGEEVAHILGASYSIRILLKQDINGDGNVNSQDVQLMAQEILASKASPSSCVHDMNGDGVCNVRDLIDVIRMLGK